MSYVLACYALVVAAVVAYAVRIELERRRLLRALAAGPGSNRG